MNIKIGGSVNCSNIKNWIMNEFSEENTKYINLGIIVFTLNVNMGWG